MSAATPPSRHETLLQSTFAFGDDQRRCRSSTRRARLQNMEIFIRHADGHSTLTDIMSADEANNGVLEVQIGRDGDVIRLSPNFWHGYVIDPTPNNPLDPEAGGQTL
jgi:hypothetical protein